MTEDSFYRYFGYGANSHPDMMAAIIGRKPKGTPFVLDDYELCIQEWPDIPQDIRDTIEYFWDENFKTYCIRPKEGSRVSGMLWEITPEEHRLVAEWELHGRWYDAYDLVHFGADGAIDIKIEFMRRGEITRVVDGEKYDIFLNSPETMFRAAEEDREKFLSREREKAVFLETINPGAES